MCVCDLTASPLLPALENLPPEAVAKYYRHLPYDQRAPAHEVCVLLNLVVAENQELPIIGETGHEFSDIKSYIASLDPKAQTGLTALQNESAFKGQPAWVGANPFMLFFVGVLSNYITPDYIASDRKRLARKLHEQASNLGYKRDKSLNNTSGVVHSKYVNDPRAQQFWQAVGDQVVDASVRNNNPYALLIRGLCEIDGIGMNQDIKKGLYHLQSSADQHVLLTLDFLHKNLDSEGRYVGSGETIHPFGPKYVAKITKDLPLLRDPLSHLFDKIEELKKEEGYLAEADLSLMLRSLPDVMISARDISKYQQILQKHLEDLFKPGHTDFDEVYPLTISFAIGSIISLVELGLKSDFHSSHLFQVGVFVMITAGWCIACYERHHFPYFFKKRKKKYLLSHYNSDQRNNAACLLSYQLMASFGKRLQPESAWGPDGYDPNLPFLENLVDEIDSVLSGIKRKKDQTFSELLLEAASKKGLLNEASLPQVTMV